MKISFRLILLYLAITAFLLTIFCISIYIESNQYRKTEFKSRLKKEATLAANIYFNKSEISPEIFRILDKNNITSLNDEELYIYNGLNKIVYESGDEKLKIADKWIEKIKLEKECFWNVDKKEYFGFSYIKDKKLYVIISSAFDKYGYIKQKNLAFTLCIGALIILLLSSLTGWFFVRRMLNPLQNIISRIDNIKASQLGIRLEIGKPNDEFSQLSIRFNRMLERIEKAFLAQKSFVSHASHELRTPLTSITGQIQVSLLANDSPKDLRKMIASVLEDVQHLNKLSNNLLDLTYLSADAHSLNLSMVNILDKLSRVRNQVLKENSNCLIDITFEELEDDIPELLANPSLLYTAFYNLIENGIKYSSDKKVNVFIKNCKAEIEIEVQNQCSELNSEDLKTIFEPFRRGSNAKSIKGHGVGLSLTKGIIEIFNGNISVNYSKEKVIIFTIQLPKSILI